VRMYADRIAAGDVSQRQARIEVGELLGITAETLRNWIRRDLGEAGRPAVPTAEPVDSELARLRREHAQLRRANEIEDRLSVFAQAELDRKLGSSSTSSRPIVTASGSRHPIRNQGQVRPLSRPRAAR